ncbi:MAG: alpha-E domain-containing protein [Candidatus Omnitrophica bacterium]|nr:alpha-E domain-containing protein [Candidatus Omnitrophota bacterium]
MLSRVAESIYWMSRYIERAENYARFMDVNLSLIVDLPTNIQEQWQPLVNITGDAVVYESMYGEYTRNNVVEFLTFNKNNLNSILSCLIQARENARTIREIISSEMWQQINEMYLGVKDATLTANDNLSEFYRYIKNGSHLFNGIMDTTLIHNEAYHFANLGRLLERADKTDRILDMKYFYLLPRIEDVGTTLDYMQWSALLKSTSAYEVYRKKYGKMDYRDIIEFLIFDREFPRAIHFCLIESDKSLHTISNTQLGTFNNSAEKEMGKIISQLNFNDVNDVIHYGLHEYLEDFQIKLNHLGEEIFNTFFSRSLR